MATIGFSEDPVVRSAAPRGAANERWENPHAVRQARTRATSLAARGYFVFAGSLTAFWTSNSTL